MWNMTKLHAKPWSIFIVISFLDLVSPTPLTALFMCSLAGNSALGLGTPAAPTEPWTTRNFPHRAAEHPQQSPPCLFLAGRTWATRPTGNVFHAAPAPQRRGPSPEGSRWPRSAVGSPWKWPTPFALAQPQRPSAAVGLSWVPVPTLSLRLLPRCSYVPFLRPQDEFPLPSGASLDFRESAAFLSGVLELIVRVTPAGKSWYWSRTWFSRSFFPPKSKLPPCAAQNNSVLKSKHPGQITTFHNLKVTNDLPLQERYPD